jgi:hypothetical protein
MCHFTLNLLYLTVINMTTLKRGKVIGNGWVTCKIKGGKREKKKIEFANRLPAVSKNCKNSRALNLLGKSVEMGFCCKFPYVR